ncbi:MAG: DUF3667 domain-containing protein [Xanthomonadales bacterium]|jgi:hypothetical protein|nr:DUF3667 domain-containing protein [Xanthomonadales bacterium]
MTGETRNGEEERPSRALAVSPDPALTLRASARAGSPACLNCGTSLEGPFCHYCGQPDRNFLRFFPALLREFLSEALELDSRFTRTMKPLLFIPGRLTRDYLDGRRFRYTPPVRLYLFSSIIFFLLAAFLSSDAIEENVTFGGQGSGIQITADTEEDLARVEEALGALPPELRAQIDTDLSEARVREREQEDFFSTQEIRFNDQPWHPEDNPVDFAWLPDSMNAWINEEIGRSPEKAKRINENPRLIVREIFDILPATMFVLLPVVALIFKFWYLFSGHYYIEHLILALHNHSFVFVALIISLFLEALEMFAAGRGLGWLEAGAYWSSYIVGFWIPIYLVLSLRTVYRQGWFLTLGKGFCIGISYLTLLVFVTTVVALLGFILV